MAASSGNPVMPVTISKILRLPRWSRQLGRRSSFREAVDPIQWQNEFTRHGIGYGSIFVEFDSTQSQKVLIPTQLMTHNDFQELIQINSQLEVVFWNLIQIDS